MAVQFDPANNRRMEKLQAEIGQVLLRFNREEPVPEVICVFALMRLSRVLLNKLPERTRAMTLDQVIVPYLRNETVREIDPIILVG